jgi:hypothetical protein
VIDTGATRRAGEQSRVTTERRTCFRRACDRTRLKSSSSRKRADWFLRRTLIARRRLLQPMGCGASLLARGALLCLSPRFRKDTVTLD